MKMRVLIIVSVVVLSLFAYTHSASATILTQAQLVKAYNSGQKINILIVPGHDNEYWGTEFRDVKEADMTLPLGLSLYSMLAGDPHFNVTITRNYGDYTPTFVHYFYDAATSPSIQDFISSTHHTMDTALSTGALLKVDGVPHNNVNSDIALRLYGINKWINENNISLVLHIHFNDNPERPENNPGPYRGFVVYIPEKQYDNATVSRSWGGALYNELKKYYPQSILPTESAGLVEDQDLIAIGPGNSLKAGSALVEYGYIYEPQFLDSDIRSDVIDDLAFQSYLGIHSFFGDEKKYTGKYGTALLPHTWTAPIKKDAMFDENVLALQAGLRNVGLYPAKDMNAFDCRMTGNFDPCTKMSLTEFQIKYKSTIPVSERGTVGPKTRAKLNALFSS